MTLREVQSELSAITDRLAALNAEISRRPRVQKGRRVSAKMTPEIADGIRRMHVHSPDMTQLEIAEQFNVSPGRVSEILRGKRK